MNFKINYTFGTKKGRLHIKNEDDRIIIKTNFYYLFLLFDGVSSAENSTAGNLRAKKFIKNNHNKYFENETLNLSKLLMDVNADLIGSKLKEPYSAYCAVYINLKFPDLIHYTHLGDCRIYFISNQYIEPITQDDNISSYRNIITKYLGKASLNERDFQVKSKISLDRVLLCSDGFYYYLEEHKNRFFEILNFAKLENISKALLKEIKNNQDDASFILINRNV